MKLTQIELAVGISSAPGLEGIIFIQEGRLFISLRTSDGRYLKEGRQLILKTTAGLAETLSSCSHFQIAYSGATYVMSYRKEVKKKVGTVTASSKDGLTWKVNSKNELTAPLYPLSRFLYKGQIVAYQSDLQIAFSEDGKKWKMSSVVISDSFRKWLPKDARVIGSTRTSQGILLVYQWIEKDKKTTSLCLGGLLCSTFEPYLATWITQLPFFKEKIKETDTIEELGLIATVSNIIAFWKKNGALMSVELPALFARFDVVGEAKLFKYSKNPIITPIEKHYWESGSTFNPAAVYVGGRVHLLYRAMGHEGLSRLGYASSADGLVFDERLPYPVYSPSEDFEGAALPKSERVPSYDFASGGGWGGCEDPRLTLLDDTIYLAYVAYDGWSPPRVALSSISVEDFLAKKWNWKRPKLISRPHRVDKNAAVLPGKINGKYVVFHRVFPNILIDFVDSLDFKDGEYLQDEFRIEPRPSMWDSRKLGIGATPIKTEKGWLLIYQAVDDRHDSQYKMGAMILDLNDPTKVLYRTTKPILVPDMRYENDGAKAGVAYPCGAVVKEGTLFVYYGGADSVVCVATAPLAEFLENVMTDKVVTFALGKVRLK